MLNYRFLPGVACLGTLLAVAAAGAADTPGEHPPIPIRFHLESPGMVTLVIEEAHGVRVRNLVSETPFPAGDNIAWWDGLDDLARDGDAATHGVFHIPGKIVAAGDYRVRGLVHAPLDITYEMTPYFPGDPPWITGDRASGWLANHNPPSAVCFVPAGLTPLRKDQKGDAPAQMLIGSHVSEGGSGLAWVGLDGKKLHGQEWLGGVWTGAQYLTRDVGPQRDNEVYAYTAAYWEGDKYNGFRSELRLHALHKIIDRTKAPKDQRFGTGEDWRVLNPTYLVQVKPEAQKKSKLGGIAAHDGILVVSIPANDQLVFFDARQRQVLGAGTLAAPGGVAFDDTGRLFAVSGETVVRFDRLPKFASGAPAATEPSTSTTPAVTLPPATPIITQNLEEPQQLLIDSGRILVSDWGASQQVKIFSAEGKLERTIGEPGGPELGVYHPTRMHRPLGIAVDSSHLLWVAENDYSPKRISIWSLDGKLERASMARRSTAPAARSIPLTPPAFSPAAWNCASTGKPARAPPSPFTRWASPISSRSSAAKIPARPSAPITSTGSPTSPTRSMATPPRVVPWPACGCSKIPSPAPSPSSAGSTTWPPSIPPAVFRPAGKARSAPPPPRNTRFTPWPRTARDCGSMANHSFRTGATGAAKAPPRSPSTPENVTTSAWK